MFSVNSSSALKKKKRQSNEAGGRKGLTPRLGGKWIQVQSRYDGYTFMDETAANGAFGARAGHVTIQPRWGQKPHRALSVQG